MMLRPFSVAVLKGAGLGGGGGTGPAGPAGPAGADGASAYEVAVQNGFVGTEAQWLASLVGPAGADGSPGADGAKGDKGDPGPAGADSTVPGPAGADGASAYEVAVAAGFVGTQAQWLASLVGPAGPQGEPGSGGAGGGIASYTYADRAQLRTTTGTHAVVEGLGLFEYAPGSDEPDDDESCFATSSGRWLMVCPHWDAVSAWQLPDDEVRGEYDEDEPLRFASSFASSFASKVLSGTATCAITSVASVSSTSFTGTVTGAAVGDRVIATPPGELGATAAATARLSYHARVTATDTVTITLANASAAIATTHDAIRTAWPITVIKGVQP